MRNYTLYAVCNGLCALLLCGLFIFFFSACTTLLSHSDAGRVGAEIRLMYDRSVLVANKRDSVNDDGSHHHHRNHHRFLYRTDASSLFVGSALFVGPVAENGIDDDALATTIANAALG